jgi:acetyl-CoA acetyltransferase
MVSVVQREWAAKNPRAAFKEPITIEDVLNSRTIPRTSCCGGELSFRARRSSSGMHATNAQ